MIGLVRLPLETTSPSDHVFQTMPPEGAESVSVQMLLVSHTNSALRRAAGLSNASVSWVHTIVPSGPVTLSSTRKSHVAQSAGDRNAAWPPPSIVTTGCVESNRRTCGVPQPASADAQKNVPG